jgi:hypothetical protein
MVDRTGRTKPKSTENNADQGNARHHKTYTRTSTAKNRRPTACIKASCVRMSNIQITANVYIYKYTHT